MAQELLVAEDVRVTDGRTFLTELRRAGFEPTVAAWARYESGRWSLCLGTITRDRDERLAIRQKLIDAFGKLAEPWFSLIDVSLIDFDGLLAHSLLRLRGRLTGREVGHFQVDELAGQPVREVYVYPPVGPMTPREVVRAVADRMVGGGATVDFLNTTGHKVLASTVQFRNGKSGQYYPVGISGYGDDDLLNATKGVHVHLKDVNTGQIDLYRPDEIDEIR